MMATVGVKGLNNTKAAGEVAQSSLFCIYEYIEYTWATASDHWEAVVSVVQCFIISMLQLDNDWNH